MGYATLTDVEIKKAKPRDKPFKLSDGNGLHPYINPAGSRLWRYRYEIDGKEKLLSSGQYLVISLAEARRNRDEAREKLRNGKDPALAKKLQKLSGAKQSTETFETIAKEWFQLQKSQWVDRHAADVIESLENEVFSFIGDSPIRDIGVLEVNGRLT